MPDRLERAPCGFVEFADDGRILYANATLAGWLGTTPPQLLGQSFESILTVANRVFFQTHFFPLLRMHREADEIFLALRRSDGGSVPVVARALRFEGDAGPRNQCAFITVHQRRKYEDEIIAARQAAENALRSNDELLRTKQDLEQRGHELERRLREVQARNDELQRVVQVLSHDLKEPIRKIALFSDLVREQSHALDEEGVGALGKIDAEADRMDQLLKAVREFLEADSRAKLEDVEL